jgi:hypothetical protein
VGQKTPGWKMQDVQQQALICNDKVHCCQMAEFWAAGLKNGPVKLLAA